MTVYLSRRISLATQNRIEYAAVRSLLALAHALPTRAVTALGERFGRLAWRAGIRRRTVLTNLRLAFGDTLDEAGREALAERCYRHFGREVFHLLVLDREARRPLADWLDAEGLEALPRPGTGGALVVGGHLGFWEAVGIALPRLGYPLTVFTGRQQNRRADALLNRLRASAGCRLISYDDDREELLERARTGLVALAGDQRPHKAPIEVDFFGHPTRAAQGAAAICQLTGCELVFSSCVRVGGRYRLRLERVDYERSDSRRENIRRLTQAYFRTLEAEVRRYPEQYFWMHRRWKKLPGAEYDKVETLF